MPDHRKLILIGSVALAAWFFIEYAFLRGLLPEYISETPIKVSGLITLIGVLAVFYIVLRKIIKVNPEISFFYLVVFGGLISLFGEPIFQTYRISTFEYETSKEKGWLFFTSVLIGTLINAVISLSIAMDLKFKNRWLSTGVMIGLFFLIKFAGEYFGILNL